MFCLLTSTVPERERKREEKKSSQGIGSGGVVDGEQVCLLRGGSVEGVPGLRLGAGGRGWASRANNTFQTG